MPLDPHTRKYHSKKCPDCRKRVGQDYVRCGECDEKRKLEALVLANGAKLYKKRGGAIHLSSEARANIGAANRWKAKRAVDDSIGSSRK